MQRREFIAAVGAAAASAVSQSSPIYAQPVGGLAVAALLLSVDSDYGLSSIVIPLFSRCRFSNCHR